MNLDMNQLRAFVTVAELRSFSKASNTLCRVQSAISQQIQKLESALGAELFIRGGRTLQLTSQGDSLLAYASRILDLNDSAVARLTGVDCAGVIKVGSSDTYATRYFSPLIKQCAQRFPDMQVEVHCGYSAVLWDRYEAGELDVVLTQGCPAHIPSELLYSEPLTWVVDLQSRVFETDPVPLALFTKGCGDRELVVGALNRVAKAYQISYQSTSHSGVLAALSTGCYVSALLLSAVDASLRVLHEEDGFPMLGNLEIALAYHDRSHASLARRFAEVARRYFHSLNVGHCVTGSRSMRSDLAV